VVARGGWYAGALTGLLFCAVFFRWSLPLGVGAHRRRRRRPGAAVEGALPERAVLRGPGRGLLRGLGRPGVAADALVEGGGPHRQPTPAAPLPDTQRPGTGPVRADNDVRVVRLGHVAGPALVLDDLRRHCRLRSGSDSVLLHGLDGGARFAPQLVADRGDRRRAARPRQPDAGVRDVLGLCVVLAVFAGLVGQ